MVPPPHWFSANILFLGLKASTLRFQSFVVVGKRLILLSSDQKTFLQETFACPHGRLPFSVELKGIDF